MAVVEAGSMSRAAEALSLTPSGVGRSIARLEARVGVRLLERTTRTMTLTDEGRRFYEEVGPHLDGIEQAAMTAARAAGTVRGRLRVNVDPFFSRLVLAGQVATFLDRHPEVRLELIMRDHVGDLVADGFDLALRFGEPPSGSLIARKLIETRILTVASPGFVARHGRPSHRNARRLVIVSSRSARRAGSTRPARPPWPRCSASGRRTGRPSSRACR